MNGMEALYASMGSFLGLLLVKIPAFMTAISVHEFAHAKTAELLGDDTPRFFGRVTLNPFAHLDVLGTISLLFFGIGWAKPVPYDPRSFRNPVLGSIMTALAGPFANLFLAMALIGAEVIVTAVCVRYGVVSPVFSFLKLFLTTAAILNVVLAIFNLLPIPPLDGGHIFMDPLAARNPKLVTQILRWAPLILLFLLLVSPAVLTAVEMASSTVYAAMRTVWKIFVAVVF